LLMEMFILGSVLEEEDCVKLKQKCFSSTIASLKLPMSRNMATQVRIWIIKITTSRWFVSKKYHLWRHSFRAISQIIIPHNYGYRYDYNTCKSNKFWSDANSPLLNICLLNYLSSLFWKFSCLVCEPHQRIKVD